MLVHGFTQTSASWEPVAADLATDHEVVTVDAPGHGGSSDVELDLVATGHALAALGGPAIYVGYSMGARMALHAALERPDSGRGLVLISGTAGIDDAAERAARRAADETLAAGIERDGAEAFLDRWLAAPMFATVPRHAAGTAERRHNTAAGLAGSLRRAGTGTQQPLWGRLGELTTPVLIVTGGLDDKFTALGRRLADGIDHATLVTLDGVGHAVPLEAPDRLVTAIRRWLA